MDSIVLLIVVLGLYSFPTIVAGVRGHPQQVPIGIVNLFFGWTLVGWVVCLAWACSAIRQDTLAGISPRGSAAGDGRGRDVGGWL